MENFTTVADIISKEAAKEFPERSNPGQHRLSDEDVNRIAEAVVEKAAEDVGIRDMMIGSAMGKGAIPLYGRETRKELCSCCMIDPEGPNTPDNRMCTTKGAIGTLNDREEREWCSEIKIVSDGRCARAMAIREAARECKEKHPTDTEEFFKCYIPAFSQVTKGSNPAAYKVGDEVFVTIASQDIPGWVVNTKTTKDHFIRYIIKIGRDKYYEASYGQLKPKEQLKRGEEILAKEREALERGREAIERLRRGEVS